MNRLNTYNAENIADFYPSSKQNFRVYTADARKGEKSIVTNVGNYHADFVHVGVKKNTLCGFLSSFFVCDNVTERVNITFGIGRNFVNNKFRNRTFISRNAVNKT